MKNRKTRLIEFLLILSMAILVVIVIAEHSSLFHVVEADDSVLNVQVINKRYDQKLNKYYMDGICDDKAQQFVISNVSSAEQLFNTVELHRNYKITWQGFDYDGYRQISNLQLSELSK